MRRSKRPCGSSSRWMRALRSSGGRVRWPEMTSTPSWMTVSTLSGLTPGSATRIRSSCSVSSTSIGGSQQASCRPNCWRSRSARVSESKASDSIQSRGFLGCMMRARRWGTLNMGPVPENSSPAARRCYADRAIRKDKRRGLPGRGARCHAMCGSGRLAVFLFRLEVDHGGGELGQRVIGRLFLVQRRLQQPCGVLHAELLGPGAQGAVAGDLVVLDRLRGCEQAGVERRRVLELLHDLGAFVGDAVDRFARLAAGRLAQHLEDLVQTFDLALGLAQMLVESRRELLRVGGLGHLGQGLDDLVLGEIDVFERL